MRRDLKGLPALVQVARALASLSHWGFEWEVPGLPRLTAVDTLKMSMKIEYSQIVVF